MLGDLRTRQDIFLRQLCAQLLGDIGHARKVLHTEMMDPAAQLFRAHASLFRLKSQRFHFRLQGRQGQPGQAGRPTGLRIAAA